MKSSNIVAGSNVFLSREDDPRLDEEFIAQIQDYNRLKGIAERRKVDYRIAGFSNIQEEILRAEMRCCYAKNDPCWGYVKKRNRVVSACINVECPNIKKCNPTYSPTEAKYWIPSDAEKKMYGDPEKLLELLQTCHPDEKPGKYAGQECSAADVRAFRFVCV